MKEIGTRFNLIMFSKIDNLIIPFKDSLWLLCEYPRLINVNFGVQSKITDESLAYQSYGILHYEASAELDSNSAKTYVYFKPNHELELTPR